MLKDKLVETLGMFGYVIIFVIVILSAFGGVQLFRGWCYLVENDEKKFGNKKWYGLYFYLTIICISLALILIKYIA